MITLTEGQNTILKQSIDILSRDSMLVITGKAGTGKTTLVKFLIDNLKQNAYHKYRKSICTAPTNKAVKVLRDKIGNNIYKNSFSTIHSALKLKRAIHPKTGEINFMPEKSSSNRKDPLEDVSLLILDEASMLNAYVLDLLMKEIRYRNIKIIFIGDEGQLPPVGEPYSPVFHQNFPVLELTEIIRQGKDNPIIALSRDFDILKSKEDSRNDIGGYLFSNDYSSVINTLALVNGSDKLKYLAWTNQEIDKINKAVREKIYLNPNKIELGESLIFNTPYGETYFTNDEIKVENLSVSSKYYTSYKIINPGYNVETMKEGASQYLQNTKVLKTYTVNNSILIIHEDSEKDFEDMIKDTRKKCKEGLVKWVDFFRFYETFADIKYNHAITIHKSQGSTYQQVIINIRDCMYNKDTNERDKLLYTAITRASNLVILYNT